MIKKDKKNGTPAAIRTQDPLLRRQMLYPAELRAHSLFYMIQRIEKRASFKNNRAQSSRSNLAAAQIPARIV